MKIDRLIGILTTLQQQGKVTAPYLADKFEVSRRTINRDIEDICRAGIPIVTTQGADGGISIMDGYCLDTTIFTQEELQAILVGLQSLDSVSQTKRYARLAGKIGADRKVISVSDSMIIDLASFYKDSLAEKISLLQEAIYNRNKVSFCYFYEKGSEKKFLEPYIILFKWSAWYIFGYSRERRDFRLYKLNRMSNLQCMQEKYEVQQIPKEKLNFGTDIKDDIIIYAVYDKSVEYRLVEEYGPQSYRKQKDGRLYTEWGFSSYTKALEWFLGFGSKVEILAPEDFKRQYLNEIGKIQDKYKDSET